MEIYNIDFDLWVERMLPEKYRKPKFIALMKAFVAPLKDIHKEVFENDRIETIRTFRSNSQKIVFEKVLNDYFDVQSEQKIYTTSSFTQIEPLFIYGEAETEFAPEYFYSEEEEGVTYITGEADSFFDVDFVVRVPQTWQDSNGQTHNLTNEEDRINSKVAELAIVGVKWIITAA